jgi:exodeoxyribonuclease-3
LKIYTYNVNGISARLPNFLRWLKDSAPDVDHLLLNPALAGRLSAAGVARDVRGWEKPSDHAPTWIELR